MKGDFLQSGNILELFNKGGRISSVGPQSLFYLTLTKLSTLTTSHKERRVVGLGWVGEVKEVPW